jgi:hypothetical protein
MDLYFNNIITDKGTKNMIYIQNLFLPWNKNISDEGIKIWYKCKI